MTVRVGVIGTGIMGAEHARLLERQVSGVVVTGAFDVDTERCQQAVTGMPSAQVFSDPIELIFDPGIDAVVIASADLTHERFALAAIAAGKPVLCEKPLAPDIPGCERILAAEVAAGRRLVSVGFMRRFDPGHRQLKQALAGGDIGTALLMHCVHRNRSAPAGQPTGSLITGSAVHEFDAARWLLDDELATVAVHRPRSSRRSSPTADPLFLVVESSAGVLVDIEVFLNCGYGYEVRCEVVGEYGTIFLDAPAATAARGAAGISRSLAEDWRPRFAEAYRCELQEWIDSVAAGQVSSLASTWDGYAATATAQAGVAALDSGRTEPVRLPPRPNLYGPRLHGAEVHGVEVHGAEVHGEVRA